MDHAQICKLSGFIHMRHDDPTVFLASCMKEVHKVEPKLQPLTGETFRHRTANTDPDARADIRVRGFWTQGNNAFFDTRVFYPYARSYQSKPLKSLFQKMEEEKKREYGERIKEDDHGKKRNQMYLAHTRGCFGLTDVESNQHTPKYFQ